MRNAPVKRPIPQLTRRRSEATASNDFLDILSTPDDSSILKKARLIVQQLLTLVWLKLRRWYERDKRSAYIVAAGVIVLGLMQIPKLTKPATTTTTTKPPATAVNGRAALPKGTPEFNTVLPEGKSIESLGGWTRVSPPDRSAVYAYTDTLDGTDIIVSQQPLPNDFRTDTTEHMATLAKDFGAQKHFTLHSTDIYIGTSVKGPQSVLFTKNKLLILIKASKKISDDAWASYIEKLV